MSELRVNPILLLATPLALPLVAAVGGAILLAGLSTQIAGAVGAEVATRLDKPRPLGRLGRAGVRLHRFTTPIPVGTLARGAAEAGLELLGTAILNDEGGTPAPHLLLGHGDDVLLAVRADARGGCELITPADRADLAAMLATGAVVCALKDEARAQGYDVMVAPSGRAAETRAGARRRSHIDERIVLTPAWDGARRLDLKLESAAISAAGDETCPDVAGLLTRLGLAKDPEVIEQVPIITQPPGSPSHATQPQQQHRPRSHR